MGAFSGLREAKTYERGHPLSPGKHGLTIQRCLIHRTRSKGDAFIVEFTVRRSGNPADPVGSKRTWYQSMQDKDIAWGAIKAFAAGVAGIDPADKEAMRNDLEPTVEDDMEKAVDPKQNALAGADVDVDVVVIKTKPTKEFPEGRDFSRHNWMPAFDHEIAAR